MASRRSSTASSQGRKSAESRRFKEKASPFTVVAETVHIGHNFRVNIVLCIYLIKEHINWVCRVRRSVPSKGAALSDSTTIVKHGVFSLTFQKRSQTPTSRLVLPAVVPSPVSACSTGSSRQRRIWNPLFAIVTAGSISRRLWPLARRRLARRSVRRVSSVVRRHRRATASSSSRRSDC